MRAQLTPPQQLLLRDELAKEQHRLATLARSASAPPLAAAASRADRRPRTDASGSGSASNGAATHYVHSAASLAAAQPSLADAVDDAAPVVRSFVRSPTNNSRL